MPGGRLYTPGVANEYSWNVARDRRRYRLPGPDRMGWWATVAMLLSILLHVILFFALDHMKIALRFDQAKELSTRPVSLRQVQVRPSDFERSQPPPEKVVQPPKDTAKLLDDVDLLNVLPKNEPIDIKPQVEQAEYALKLQNPAQAGSPETAAPQAMTGFEIETALPELGREPESIKPAALGQIIVDPGRIDVGDAGLGKFAEDLIKQGANGSVDTGKLDGVVSLDDIGTLSTNALLGAKTMLPSDLLFEFNRAELRESAKVGLLKLTLLIDKNPGLYCWIEGYTDLIGSDEANLALSVQRAESVKRYLCSIGVNPARIMTRGYGRENPLVPTGTAAQQAKNRRVEIRMRKTPPTEPQRVLAPKRATVVQEEPAPEPEQIPEPIAPEPPPPPKATLVKPKRALPVEEEVLPPPSPPKAAPVSEEDEPAPPLKAEPVPEEP